MNLNSLSRRVHANAKNKGFWDDPKEIGTQLMLCVSELSEALEADRKGRYSNPTDCIWGKPFSEKAFEVCIKDTFEDEIADTVIRLMDICGSRGIDIDWHIEQKMQYNESRKKLHGKKY